MRSTVATTLRFSFLRPSTGTPHETEPDEEHEVVERTTLCHGRFAASPVPTLSITALGRSWSTKFGPPDPECRRCNRRSGAPMALGIHVVFLSQRWRHAHPNPGAPTQHGGVLHENDFGSGRTPPCGYGSTRARPWSCVYGARSVITMERNAPAGLRHVSRAGSATGCVHRIQMELGYCHVSLRPQWSV